MNLEVPQIEIVAKYNGRICGSYDGQSILNSMVKRRRFCLATFYEEVDLQRSRKHPNLPIRFAEEIMRIGRDSTKCCQRNRTCRKPGSIGVEETLHERMTAGKL